MFIEFAIAFIAWKRMRLFGCECPELFEEYTQEWSSTFIAILRASGKCGDLMPHDGTLDLDETIVMVPAHICEDCEYIGETTEFVAQAGTKTVANPLRCPNCKSNKLTQGEVQRKLFSKGSQ